MCRIYLSPVVYWWTKLNDRPEEHVIPLSSETNDLKKTTRSHMKRNSGTAPPNNRSSIIYFPSAENFVFVFFSSGRDFKPFGNETCRPNESACVKRRSSSSVRDCASYFPKRRQQKEKKCWASSFTSGVVCRLYRRARWSWVIWGKERPDNPDLLQYQQTQ